ncbi:MAG: hypothetical protein EBX50_06260 [Chitinophagia bacterium]|nr:hypothetical protein [Chitinophagia bacterium]
MLFIAVTLGFFAENYREHQIIQHKMEENYQALSENLRQDSISLQRLLEDNVQEREGILSLLDLLYLFQDKKIGTDSVKSGMLKIQRLPSYQTLFMDNSTFKNMQSSGMLGYVADKEFRKGLSFYYEVIFKKLIDNNVLYDQDGKNFYTEQFQVILPPANRELDSIIGSNTNLARSFKSNSQLSEPYRSVRDNKKFILNHPFSKNLIENPKTLFYVEAFYQRFLVYNYLLITIQEENRKLALMLHNIK